MSDFDPYGPLPEEDRKRLVAFQRSMEEAEKRGENTTPLLKDFVLSSIDELLEHHPTRTDEPSDPIDGQGKPV